MGEEDSNCILNAVIIGVVISFVMPRVLLMFAEPSEIKLPLQLDNLSEKAILKNRFTS